MSRTGPWIPVLLLVSASVGACGGETVDTPTLSAGEVSAGTTGDGEGTGTTGAPGTSDGTDGAGGSSTGADDSAGSGTTGADPTGAGSTGGGDTSGGDGSTGGVGGSTGGDPTGGGTTGPGVDECGIDAPCPSGQVCVWEVGTCAMSGNTICVAVPQICTLEYDPQCGCDGVTYGNECQAYSAKQNILHPGEC